MPANPSPDHRSDGQARRETVVVLAGGDGAHPDLLLPAADLVVAADSGAELAVRMRLAVDLLVGDLDSIKADTLVRLREGGTEVHRHHPDKDATDLELALALATAEDPTRLILVGGHGGRLDHALATPAALAAVARPGRQVEAWLGAASVQVTQDEARIDARPGELVSLLAWGGLVHGLSTDGLRWALHDFTLEPGSTRGVSNEATTSLARVSVTSGTLLVVRPHALEPAADGTPVAGRPAPTEGP